MSTNERIAVRLVEPRTFAVSIMVTLPEGTETRPHADRPDIHAKIAAVRELWKDLGVGWTASEVRDIVNGPPA